MKTLTQRCCLVLIALALLIGTQAAWAVPPCSLCPFLSPGQTCILPNGERGFCPSKTGLTQEERNLEAFLQELAALDETDENAPQE